jgi:hypothetical protein
MDKGRLRRRFTTGGEPKDTVGSDDSKRGKQAFVESEEEE